MAWTSLGAGGATASPALGIAVASLHAVCATVPDPRRAQGRRDALPALLTLAVAAILANHLSEQAIAAWGAAQRRAVKRARGFPNGKTPQQSTRQRLFQRRDPDALATALTRHFDPPPLPVAPGRSAREDDEYVRGGVCSLFLVGEPLRGWQHVTVSARRTRCDFAHCIRELVDVHDPDAEQIVLVMDNLNTHSPASLYEAFPPNEAKRLADKLAIHDTPKHGSWRNMAALALHVLAGQCLDRRLPDQATLTAEVAAWETARNAADSAIDWRFTTADARIKLKHLYPVLDD